MGKNISRENIITKAIHNCLCEMYAKAQPEADLDNIIEEYRSGKLTKDDKVYERHYLSMDEFLYIRDKYKDAYNIKKTWIPDLEFLEKLLTEGGLKDKYNPDWTDENGNHHPGYRSAEDVKPIKEQIFDVLKEYHVSDIANEEAQKITDIVMNTIKNYKDFYKFDREEDLFDVNIALGTSPTSDAETVKKWWKENYNQDIEIEERNPRLFWYRDHGYTDEDLAEEFSDLGENWKEELDKQWKDEVAKKERERKEAFDKYKEKFDKEHKV